VGKKVVSKPKSGRLKNWKKGFELQWKASKYTGNKKGRRNQNLTVRKGEDLQGTWMRGTRKKKGEDQKQ